MNECWSEDHCHVGGEICDLVAKKIKENNNAWVGKHVGKVRKGSLFGAEVLSQEEAINAVDKTGIDGGRNANIHISREHWRCCKALQASRPCPWRGEATPRLCILLNSVRYIVQHRELPPKTGSPLATQVAVLPSLTQIEAAMSRLLPTLSCLVRPFRYQGLLVPHLSLSDWCYLLFQASHLPKWWERILQD